jgi:hypothetical protein
MFDMVWESFEQNPDALAKLLATGNATLTHTQDKTKWGTEFPRLLMKVRDELRGDQPTVSKSETPLDYSYKVSYEKLKAVIPESKFDSLFIKIEDLLNNYRIGRDVLDTVLTKSSDKVKDLILLVEKQFRSENIIFGTPEFDLNRWEKNRKELSTLLHSELKKVYPNLPELEKVQSVAKRKAAQPIVEPVESREPINKIGTMSFSYNNLQRPDVLSRTTFDAIEAGERTATTRFPEDTDGSYWFDTMPGDTITFWSGKSTNQGKAIDVKVISVNPVDFTKMTDEELENWSKLEGWSLDYARNKKGLPKRNKGIQIVFEKIEKGGEGNVITDTNTDNLDNSDEMDNTCSTPFLD